MRKLKKDYYCGDHEEIEGVFSLLEKNVDCTNQLIKHIDNLIENKYFSEPVHKALTLLRNTCAVNVMNIAQLTN
ncbi:hypothetical protein [Aquimarina mytili]|uniref:Uncharacterized protein n=1 Tax=Aquimarina mytili TaxID=874423 RepID=A0A937DAN6_9FLAO|nr:hypothetical protein [Aquimarina mytili]MBL0684927.1 hypothetical protein [Aquimarina mytili]